ncbi:MAG TPA: FAD-dependent oxidoreductase [Burkholderiales bacterium]|jgi:3-oxosteroid 1-dehydrogenase|nr:FAD-dependent oxidoreductase [Burkholderiales bacterium]
MSRKQRTKKTAVEARRKFLKVAGAGGAAAAFGVVTLSGRQVQAASFDGEYDIVVCGGGGGGLPSALFSRWLGNKVLVLEKAGTLGGTSFKAAYWYWVPNNMAMRKAGMEDSKTDFLRYVARLSAPQTFNPDAPRYGLSEWEYSMCEAIWDSAADAAELLAEKGALPYRHVAPVPDYFAEMGYKGNTGRVLFPKDGSASMSDGGRVATRTLSAACRRDGVDIKTGHRVQRVIRNDKGEVIGVEAGVEGGGVFRARARKAVIFATGGFTHDPELRKNFLSIPVYGGCAAMTNEGDFVRISSTLGVQLRNMNYAWMCPISLDKAIARDPSLSGMFSVAGDSMIFVDKRGRRVVNEKLQYNELAQKFFEWDGAKAEFPYLVLISIWDQRSQDHSASPEYGRLIVPPGTDDRHVIKGNTLEELSAGIDARMQRYAPYIGGMRISADFVSNLKASIARFNEFARTGKDLDFGRGDRPVEQLFNGPVKEEPGRKNPTMWPISDQGPYYAALCTGGTLDTKGGPKTNANGQVLDVNDKPIPGLYGVGNCVASASGRAYWAGGATLGPIIAFAYRAASTANKEPLKV